jgi:hypothetical protein
MEYYLTTITQDGISFQTLIKAKNYSKAVEIVNREYPQENGYKSYIEITLQ